MPADPLPGSVSTNFVRKRIALTISARASPPVILYHMGRGQQQAASAPTRRGAKKPKKLTKKQLIEAIREVGVYNPHSFYDSDEPRGQVYITYDTGDTWHIRGWKVYRVGHVLGRDRYNTSKDFSVFSSLDQTFKEAKEAA